MSRPRKNLLGALVLLILLILLYVPLHKRKTSTTTISTQVPEAPADKTFVYRFESDGTLNESDTSEHSTSPYWWLDSGGELVIKAGEGHSVEGPLPGDDEWHTLYAQNNPIDTDSGLHPQNLFRLITRSTWKNATQEAYFKIDNYNLSESPNRSESNGILLLSRYLDETTLYYAGLRVDGTAVIKKKYKGTYYTLGQTKVFNGTYNRETNPNLLPMHEWIGVRSDIRSLPDGSVRIVLSMDPGKTGEWKKIFEATDHATDAPAIDSKAHAGIRTDFMDVTFDDYQITENP